MKNAEYLKLISAGEALIIDQCDGQRIIATANNVFGYIDPDFLNLKGDEVGQVTPDTPVDVYELVKDGMFSEFFNSLTSDTDKLCFTQDQIIGFCKKHYNWLRMNGCGTFFLFKSHNKLFVADVYFLSDRTLNVDLREFDEDDPWSAGNRYRVVVPQLATM